MLDSAVWTVVLSPPGLEGEEHLFLVEPEQTQVELQETDTLACLPRVMTRRGTWTCHPAPPNEPPFPGRGGAGLCRGGELRTFMQPRPWGLGTSGNRKSGDTLQTAPTGG